MWFRSAVGSILEQTVKPSEVVLVVDGPVSDKLDGIISEYEKLESFKVIRLTENFGHGKARRVGLENCSFELVALMDADDISLPDRFEKQLAMFVSDPELSVVGGNIAEFTGAETNVIGYRVVPEKHADICEYLKKRCPFNQMTVMLKKSDVQKVGGYLDWYCNEDYYLWIRMYLSGMKFANHCDTLVKVRVGRDTYKRRGGVKYFRSEAGIQKYMFDNRVIGAGIYMINIVKRLIVQVLMPSTLRRYVYRKFARSRINENSQ